MRVLVLSALASGISYLGVCRGARAGEGGDPGADPVTVTDSVTAADSVTVTDPVAVSDAVADPELDLDWDPVPEPDACVDRRCHFQWRPELLVTVDVRSDEEWTGSGLDLHIERSAGWYVFALMSWGLE